MSDTSPNAGSEHLLRDLAPQVLGAVIRRFHDFAAAEDAVQEALLAAAMLTGTENVAPWQLLSDALVMWTLPLSVTC